MTSLLQPFSLQDLVGGIIVYQEPEFKCRLHALESGLIEAGVHKDETILKKLNYHPIVPLRHPITVKANSDRPFNQLISTWNFVNFLDYSGDLWKVYLTPLGRSAVFEELKKYEPESLLALWKMAPNVWDYAANYKKS